MSTCSEYSRVLLWACSFYPPRGPLDRRRGRSSVLATPLLWICITGVQDIAASLVLAVLEQAENAAPPLVRGRLRLLE